MLSIKVHSAPDVYQIKVPFRNHKLDSTNCYVVRDGDDCQPLIVDTGAYSEKSAAYLSEALEELNVDPAQARFFLTHLHMDHAGLLDRIAPPEAPVFLNEDDYRQLQPDHPELRYADLEDALVREGVDAQETHEVVSRRRDRVGMFSSNHRMSFSKEGDGIQVGSYRFEVVATPGHTRGHQALFEPTSGVLFGGDHILFTLSPGVGLFLPEGDSVAAYLDSLRKVQGLGVKHLFHSHGDIRYDFEDRIEWLIGHNRERAGQVQGIVEANPGISGYEATKRMDFNVPFDCWDDISRVQKLSLLEIGAAFLRHLLAEGRISVSEGDDGVRRYRPAD